MKLIRNTIVGKLHKYLNVPVVPQDRPNPKPLYPYIAYKFIVPYAQARGQGNYSSELVSSLDDGFEYDFEETLTTQPTTTLSISAYSKGAIDDYIEAYDLAKKAMNWFNLVGYQDLQDINVVVVDTLAFGDRATLLVDNYEERIGFDVILRFTDTVKRRIETIEEWDIDIEIE